MIEATDVLDFTPSELVHIIFPMWLLLMIFLLSIIISRLSDLISLGLGLELRDLEGFRHVSRLRMRRAAPPRV